MNENHFLHLGSVRDVETFQRYLREHQIAMAGRSVEHAGGTVLPALAYERHLYCGEEQIAAWLSQLMGVVARSSAS